MCHTIHFLREEHRVPLLLLNFQQRFVWKDCTIVYLLEVKLLHITTLKFFLQRSSILTELGLRPVLVEVDMEFKEFSVSPLAFRYRCIRCFFGEDVECGYGFVVIASLAHACREAGRSLSSSELCALLCIFEFLPKIFMVRVVVDRMAVDWKAVYWMPVEGKACWQVEMRD